MSNYSERRINAILASMNSPTRYLEIGVETGETFFGISAAYKTAVDPNFLFDLNSVSNSDPTSEYFQVTSDEFFGDLGNHPKYDVVFLDGLHTWDQTYRDFCNTLLFTNEQSVIVLDDIFPCDVFSCNRDQIEGTAMRFLMTGDTAAAWHGDTYKVIPLIQLFHPSLDYCTIISDGNPQALVWRSKERNEHKFEVIKEQGSLNMADLDYLWFLRNQEKYNLMMEVDALGHVITALQ